MNRPNRTGALSRALYRVLLRLYPADFRARFGEEMATAFEQAVRARPTRRARARFLAGAIVDAVRAATAERVERWRLVSSSNVLPFIGDAAMRSIVQDLRFAVRSLGRRPAFVVAVALTLALGIGANTAIFSLLDAVLLHPLPAVAHPEQVVAIYRALNPRSPHGNVTYPMFKTMTERTKSLGGLAGFAIIEVSARTNGRAEPLWAGSVSGNYFALLGVRPQVGRLLVPADDDAPGAHPVVVLSDAMWTRAFDRNPAVVGTSIDIGGRPFTIVGVAPAGFRGTELSSTQQLWVPLTMTSSLGTHDLYSLKGNEVFVTHAFPWVSLVGRLRPSVAASTVAAELNTIAAGVDRQASDSARQARNETSSGTEVVRNPISVVSITQAAVRNDRGSLVHFVTILLVVVVLTLLIACVNVANLMLIRASERARELGVRAALGASRSRIVRQLLLESLLLATLGAAGGIAVGVLTMRLLSAFTLPGKVSLSRVGLSLDGRVLAFTIGLTAVTAVLFGLVPAIRASRTDLAAVFKAKGRASQRTPRGVLAGVQVAMSILLLVGAALFTRSLRAGLTTDLGFDPHQLAAIDMELRLDGYSSERANQYYDEAVARAAQLPGVAAAAAAAQVPLATLLMFPFDGTAGRPGLSPDTSIIAGLSSVSPGYFDVLRVPLVAGRRFTSSDSKAAPKVAIVNQAAAHVFHPTGSILGEQLQLFGMPLTVVGVVRDTKYESVRDDHVPNVFVPIAQQNPLGAASIVTRSTHPATTLLALRRALTAIDPDVPLHDARLVGDQIDAVLMPQRFGATLLGIFALISLCVSAVGIYGVIAYGVTQRATEIAVRIAIGAQRADILRLVLVRTGIAVAVGAAIGLCASVVASRALERFLYGITPLDATAFLGAAGLLALAAVVASCIPAARATRIDPMTTIRSE